MLNYTNYSHTLHQRINIHQFKTDNPQSRTSAKKDTVEKGSHFMSFSVMF